jgi:predicted  nucleic acid-binding Zn-ribbon protein
MLPISRRHVALAAALFLAVAVAVACGGGSLSVLHAKGKPSGEGPARVDIQNSSGVAVHRLYIAQTDAVDRAKLAGVTPGSGEDDAVWGTDRLGNEGLPDGRTFDGVVLEPARYDVLVTDVDNREQLVKRLNVKAGGKYLLEVGDNWTQARQTP